MHFEHDLVNKIESTIVEESLYDLILVTFHILFTASRCAFVNLEYSNTSVAGAAPSHHFYRWRVVGYVTLTPFHTANLRP